MRGARPWSEDASAHGPPLNDDRKGAVLRYPFSPEVISACPGPEGPQCGVGLHFRSWASECAIFTRVVVFREFLRQQYVRRIRQFGSFHVSRFAQLLNWSARAAP